MLKFLSFIYRFSAIFGLRTYLAKRFEPSDNGLLIGLWQAQHGFTTIWTGRQPFYKAFFAKIKHAFTFRSFE